MRVSILSVALVLAACGPSQAANDANVAGIAIDDVTPTHPVVSSTTRVKAVSPLDLVSGEGELLLYVDVEEARRSVLYPALVVLLEDELEALAEVRSRCSLDILGATRSLAASVHDFYRMRPLIVATVDVPAARVMECASVLASDEDEEAPMKIGGHTAIAIDEHVRGAHVIAVDDLVLIGDATEIRRALERRKSPVRGAGSLRERLGQNPDATFALVMDSAKERLSSAHVTVTLAAKARASGRFAFNEAPGRTIDATARQFEGFVREAGDELRELITAHLGASSPMLDGMKSLTSKWDGRHVDVSLAMPLAPDLAPSIEKAIAVFTERQSTEEARNTIGAISRGATAAYEREIAVGPSWQAVHQLCKSAIDVPAKVPAGSAYQPDLRDGHDYETGDSTAGWRCLKFAMTQPHRYQYSYRVGGNYKGPARGGPDPGPNGYEASAEGDLDGDGKTSLFTVTGVVNPQTQMLRRSATIFVSDELE